MNDTFESIAAVIRARRTLKPPQMSGARIPDDQVWQLLSLADWAPTHGNTEPWRFRVYAGDKVTLFFQIHSSLYKQHTAPDKYQPEKYEKLLHMGDKASHIVKAIQL